MPNLEELKKHAKELAYSHKVLKGGKLSRRHFHNIEEDNRVLIKAYKTINEQVKAKQHVVPAAEWLLDNFYMVEEQIKEIQHGLAQDYKDLPILESSGSNGLPRIYGIAEKIVYCTNADVDEEAITIFLREYQSIAPLASVELWTFPFMLKIALIKRIKI